MAECMIPLIVLGPKIKFEPAFDLVGIRFDGVLSEGQPLEILITARAKVPVNEELLIRLQVDAGAVLKHLGIKVDFSYNAPDFVAADHRLAIEAAIASHAQDDVPEWEKTFEGITDMNVEAAQLQSTIRLSNALMGKSEAYKSRYAA
jgi:hypothetical protein